MVAHLHSNIFPCASVNVSGTTLMANLKKQWTLITIVRFYTPSIPTVTGVFTIYDRNYPYTLTCITNTFATSTPFDNTLKIG